MEAQDVQTRKRIRIPVVMAQLQILIAIAGAGIGVVLLGRSNHPAEAWLLSAAILGFVIGLVHGLVAFHQSDSDQAQAAQPDRKVRLSVSLHMLHIIFSFAGAAIVMVLAARSSVHPAKAWFLAVMALCNLYGIVHGFLAFGRSDSEKANPSDTSDTEGAIELHPVAPQ